MKPLLITALSISVLVACNNNNRRIRTERIEDDNTKLKIEDDGRTLSIRVKTRRAENAIDYAETFDVVNMSSRHKEKLVNKILDSLGVNKHK